MKAEDESVTPDELVIRAIWTGYYDANNLDPVLPAAFSPRKDEIDGISVFRAACVANSEDILVIFAEEKQDKYALALLTVSDFIALGLSVRPAKIDTVPGHAVIPELNYIAWKSYKSGWRTIQQQLAVLANERIVRRPKT